jgi:hypothetical protein
MRSGRRATNTFGAERWNYRENKNHHHKPQYMKSTLLKSIVFGFATVGILWSASVANAQFNCPAAPYTNDASTVLLDHFDGGTVGSILALVNDGLPCGPAKFATTPSFAFGAGPLGLGQSLALYQAAGQPAGSWSYLKYPGGELLTRPTGTLECWVYLTNYVFTVHQHNYVGECQGTWVESP